MNNVSPHIFFQCHHTMAEARSEPQLWFVLSTLQDQVFSGQGRPIESQSQRAPVGIRQGEAEPLKQSQTQPFSPQGRSQRSVGFPRRNQKRSKRRGPFRIQWFALRHWPSPFWTQMNMFYKLTLRCPSPPVHESAHGQDSRNQHTL